MSIRGHSTRQYPHFSKLRGRGTGSSASFAGRFSRLQNLAASTVLMVGYYAAGMSRGRHMVRQQEAWRSRVQCNFHQFSALFWCVLPPKNMSRKHCCWRERTTDSNYLIVSGKIPECAVLVAQALPLFRKFEKKTIKKILHFYIKMTAFGLSTNIC